MPSWCSDLKFPYEDIFREGPDKGAVLKLDSLITTWGGRLFKRLK